MKLLLWDRVPWVPRATRVSCSSGSALPCPGGLLMNFRPFWVTWYLTFPTDCLAVILLSSIETLQWSNYWDTCLWFSGTLGLVCSPSVPMVQALQWPLWICLPWGTREAPGNGSTTSYLGLVCCAVCSFRSNPNWNNSLWNLSSCVLIIQPRPGLVVCLRAGPAITNSEFCKDKSYVVTGQMGIVVTVSPLPQILVFWEVKTPLKNNVAFI